MLSGSPDVAAQALKLDNAISLKEVELQQHYLGAQPTAVESLPLEPPTSYTFASTTNSFQYLPPDSSASSPTEYWNPGQSQYLAADVYSYPDGDEGGFPVQDCLADDEASGHNKSGTRQPNFLSDHMLSIYQTAKLFLQWCQETLAVSVLSSSEDSFVEGEEDAFESEDDTSWQYVRPDIKAGPKSFENDEHVLSQIPQYVLDYAPLVHLYSGEEYWPCDMGEHLHHITPQLNFTPVLPSTQHPRLDNLDALNRWEYGRHMFLTSNDNVEDHPEWLMGDKNIPVAPARSGPKSDHDFSSRVATKNLQGGRSDAPAVLVVVDKGNGVVDAFWFFFYSFNLGNVVVVRFGNHVGDWEHTVVRFHNGKPKAVFVSEHFFGQAYTYQAVEKSGKRPVVYSAIGSHAMYATQGTHSYILPWGLLHDRTDKGPLWDPALNSHMYTYDLQNNTLRPSNFTPIAPTEWFHFAGHWGDKQYPLGDSRQYFFAGNYHYVSGPLGPKFKNLGRRKICQGRESERCDVRNWLGGSRLRRVQRPFEDDEASEEERERHSTDSGIH